MSIVCHLVRKNTQLKASFIQNQILSHFSFKPYVICIEERNNAIDGGFAKELPGNINLYSLNNGKNRVRQFCNKYLLRLTISQKQILIKHLESTTPSIIHLHYGTDAGIYLTALKDTNIPKVVSFYGYECSGFPKSFLGYGKKFLQKTTFKLADVIFAMSEDMKIDLMELGCPEEKIIVHYYGTDVKRFKLNHDYREQKKSKYLIISGFAPQKGHLFLLKAFRQAYEKNKNIELTIVGDGSERDKILSFVEQNNMNNYVHVLPFVTYASTEHLQHFAEHDVFIHPSLTDTNGDKEGIPGAIVEAMAAGLPIIATEHAGIPYVIQNNITGILVKEWDIEALKEAILKLAVDAKLRKVLGISGQNFALSNLDLFEKEKKLEQTYDRLILN